MSNVTPPPPPPPPPGNMPPPPMGGGAPMPSSGAPFNVGDPFSYGWKKFTEAPLPWILLMLVVFVGIVVVEIVAFLLLAATGSHFFVTLLVGGFMFFLLFFVSFALQYGVLRSALGATEGQAPDFKQAWDMDAFGNYIITALLVAVIVGVGFLLCYIPGIIAAFLLIFAPFFAIDKKLPPVECVKASFNLVKAHVGTLIVFIILAYIVYAIGGILCGVGLLVTAPIALIATAFVYKRMTNQPVAA